MSSSAAQSYEKRRQRVKADLLQRQAVENEALAVVISLLDSGITESRLIEAAKKLTPAHYRDATEERGLTLLCGYPICSNKLKPLNFKKKYHISARVNKVYDIAERKYFCSTHCYKASKYVESQLSEAPLWSGELTTDIELLIDRTSAVTNDESVLIDKHTYVDSSSTTESLASEILQKLSLEDKKTEDACDLEEEQLGAEEELSADGESEDEAIDHLLARRRDLRLNTKPSATHTEQLQALSSDTEGLSTNPSGDRWQGSMLNRLKTDIGQEPLNTGLTVPEPTSGDSLSQLAKTSSQSGQLMTKHTVDSTNKNDRRKVNNAAAASAQVTSVPKEKDLRVVLSRHSSKATPAKTVLLDYTMPAPKAEFTPQDDVESTSEADLKAYLDRLTDWFTDETRKMLFSPVTTSTESDVPSTIEAVTEDTSTDAGDEEETTPTIQSTSSIQHSIVYHRLLKSYERLMSSQLDCANFRDKFGDIVKTFRLNKDNISAKPQEWKHLTLTLIACMSGSSPTVNNELTRLTGDKLPTVHKFIEHQKELLGSSDTVRQRMVASDPEEERVPVTDMAAGDQPDEKGHKSDVQDFATNKVIWIVQLNVVMYAMCFWIQQTSFPYLSKKLGVDNLTYGYLQTAFALFQLAGGPIFGRFGDLMGARAALTLTFASGILTYGTLVLATNIPMLFLSRAFAIFLSTIQGSQMVITDLVAPERRADAIGKLGLFYGIGMVIGPTLGGQITKRFGEEAAALTSTIGSLLSMICVYYYVPKHVKHVKEEDQNVSNVFSLGEISKLLKNKGAAFLLIVKTLVGIPIGILQSVFSRIAMTEFGLSADYNGLVLSYVGVLTMIVQGVGVGYLTKKYDDMRLMKVSVVIASGAFILLAQVTNVWQFCGALFPLSIGMTTLQVVISAAITKVVDPSDTGAMIGLGMATNNIIRAIGPTMGAYMLEIYGFQSVGYLGMIICVCVSAGFLRY